MKLISNHIQSHDSKVKSLLDVADEVIIAVAFLKSSGLKSLRRKIREVLKRGGEVKVYCGLSFYQTDPSALETLILLEKKNINFTLKVIEPEHGTFHPKLYYFRKGEEIKILAGSSNLTRGGLIDNNEVSILTDSNVNSQIENELRNYFKYLDKKSYTVFLEEGFEQYKYKYQVRKHRREQEEKDINDELVSLPNYTSTNDRRIGNHLGFYNDLANISVHEFNIRRKNYQQAKEIIVKLSKGVVSGQDFETEYSKLASIFSSTGLLRSKQKVVAHQKEISNLFLTVLKTKKKDIFRSVYNDIIYIPGFGINALTEVLNTISPDKYPIINNRSIGALIHLGFKIKKQPSNYRYQDFLKFLEITKKIVQVHKLADFNRLDHLLHTIHVWNEDVKKFNGFVPQGSRVFIKPIGHTKNHYPKNPFDQGITHVDFAHRASLQSIRPNDIIVVYGVGTTKIICIAKAMTSIWQRIAYDPNNPPKEKTWPKSIWQLNLTPKYGNVWWKQNTEIGLLRSQYLAQYPNRKITKAGTQSLGALNRGSDKIKLERDFGQFLVDKIYSIESIL